MGRAALKLVESSHFSTEEVELWSEDKPRDGHSLHYSITTPSAFRSELPAYFIHKYTEPGDVVLDPFLGGGTTALEANLLGRVAYGSDLNPLLLQIALAKLQPADFTELVLSLQSINLSRPVSVKLYESHFSPFYDIDTFRELVNLREYLQGTPSRISSFAELLALSLLHGHSAGYFSTYSLPQISVTPSEQQRLNDKRNQTPDYRAVIPRILRKAASVLRDGIPSVLSKMEDKNRVVQRDARDLSYIKSGTVDLVVTSPPLPGGANISSGQWLKLWFAGLSTDNIDRALSVCDTLEDWRCLMNEVLLELARVTRPGGRAVLDLRKITVDRTRVALDETLLDLVADALSRYWDPDLLLLNKKQAAEVNAAGTRASRPSTRPQSRMLVLRRR